jgi:hypothetical protein
MIWLIMILLGCTPKTESEDVLDFNRRLVDCPTAEVVKTSKSNVQFTYIIIGCGLKICCWNDSCFSCRKEKWY